MKTPKHIISQIKQSDVTWLTLDNIEATASLSQHAFRMRIVGEVGRFGQKRLDMNISLCNRFNALDQDEGGVLENFTAEPKSSKCCKVCEKVFNKLTANP